MPRACATAAPTSSASSRPPVHVPSLAPTPRKLNRSASQPRSAQARAMPATSGLRISPPCVGRGCAMTTIARGSPSGTRSVPSSRPSIRCGSSRTQCSLAGTRARRRCIGFRNARTGGHTNVTIRNGTISQFSTGIYFVDEVKSRIEDVTSERNRFGFYIHASSQNAIRRSTVVGNVYGLHLQDSNDNIIEGNNLVRQTYNSPGGFGIYLYRSTGNRIIENTIENNVNWGIWFSDAKGNTIFHNNVAGNSPQVSDNNPDSNHWYDAEKKEGNWWADYKGTDADNDLIGDTPYGILGPGGAVDAYPFVARDGWKKKTHSTIDHYQPPLARPPREVRLVVVSGGTVGIGRPHDSALAASSVHASSVAVQTDGRTLLALDGKTLTAWDLVGGEPSTRTVAIDDGIVGANRDGGSALIVGPRGAQQIDLVTGQQEFFDYTGVPQELAPSYKHNHIFVATPRGVELLYLNLGGRTPYTVPLDGPAGP